MDTISHLDEIANYTRVVIDKNFIDILLPILEYHQFPTNYFTTKIVDFSKQDHLILELDFTQISWETLNYAQPNVLAVHTQKPYINELIDQMTPGGIVIYNDQYPEQNSVIEESTNFFRRISYSQPEVDATQNQLITELGNLAIPEQFKNDLALIEGTKLLCQQLGIMEEEFFEAISQVF